MSDDSAQKLVPAVQNATAILRLLAAGSTPMGATQIARDAGLNVSTAFNILRTLAHEGIVSFDPADKTYRIGMGLLEFATPLLGANPADLIRPLLNAIAQEHQVMIALWQVTAGKRIVLIDRFAAPNIVQAVIARHSRLPVFAGAIGRCYAAQMKLSRSRARRGYDGVRWQSAPGFDSYWQDVQTAAQTGIGQDRGQLFRGWTLSRRWPATRMIPRALASAASPLRGNMTMTACPASALPCCRRRRRSSVRSLAGRRAYDRDHSREEVTCLTKNPRRERSF